MYRNPQVNVLDAANIQLRHNRLRLLDKFRPRNPNSHRVSTDVHKEAAWNARRVPPARSVSLCLGCNLSSFLVYALVGILVPIALSGIVGTVLLCAACSDVIYALPYVIGYMSLCEPIWLLITRFVASIHFRHLASIGQKSSAQLKFVRVVIWLKRRSFRTFIIERV